MRSEQSISKYQAIWHDAFSHVINTVVYNRPNTKVYIFPSIIYLNYRSTIVTDNECHHFFVVIKYIQTEAFSVGLTKASHKKNCFNKMMSFTVIHA